MPIEGVVLQMKSMHIDAVVNFPFPTPPDRSTLRKAERVLVHLGALKTDATSNVSTAQITDLGKAMSLFPLAPRFSRMLISGQQHGCLPYVITVVSVLSVGDPFLFEDAILRSDGSDSSAEDDEDGAKDEKRRKRKAFFQSHAVCQLSHLRNCRDLTDYLVACFPR
jgi:ATP-dependent RNA helicase DHX37/DHR1